VGEPAAENWKDELGAGAIMNRQGDVQVTASTANVADVATVGDVVTVEDVATVANVETVADAGAAVESSDEGAVVVGVPVEVPVGSMAAATENI